MHGSLHFQVYEHNLRRILLLDWLRDEHARRRQICRVQREVIAEADKPYWLAQCEPVSGAG